MRYFLLLFLLLPSVALAQRQLTAGFDSVQCFANTVKDGSGTNYTPLVDADGHLQVDVLSGGSGGSGGVQYTEGDTDATITGTAILWEDTSDTLRAVSGANPLPVDVTGTVSCNAGTNLNTSALALNTSVDGVEGLLTTIDADTSALAGTVSGAELQVDVVTLPLPTGASTAANQSTVIGHVDGIEALLATIDADTGSIDSKITACNTGAVTIATFPDNEPINVAQMNGVAVTMGNGNSGTGVQRVTIAADSTGKLEVVGDVADDAAAAGNPVLVAGVAVETDGTTPGTVSAENDAARLRATRDRLLLVQDRHPFSWCASENHSSAQTANELQAAPGASLSLYITDVIVSNGATAGSVKIVRDTGGTPTDIIEEIYVAANGGAVIPLRSALRVTTNQNVGFTSTTVTTHSVTVCGYTAP